MVSLDVCSKILIIRFSDVNTICVTAVKEHDTALRTALISSLLFLIHYYYCR